MKHVMILYRLRDDANLEEVHGAIRRFVADLRGASADVQYTSYQRPSEDSEGRSFVHVGFFPDADVLAEIQAQPFFGEFAAFLRAQCSEGPSATPLSPVASTSLP